MKRALQIIAVTVALLFMIIFTANSIWGSKVMTTGGMVVLQPFQRFFTSIGNGIGSFFSGFSDARELTKERNELKEKVASLESEIAQLERYKTENDELHASLGLKSVYGSKDSIGGNVIANEGGNWLSTFVIDVGSNDGVKVDYPVVTASGLVGRIARVSANSSVVVSVIDPWFKVSTVNSRTDQLEVCIRGDIQLCQNGECRLEYTSDDLEIGDVMETSGISDIYPKGILIGTVKEIHQSENELGNYAVITPAVDFGTLKVVSVLVPKDK